MSLPPRERNPLSDQQPSGKADPTGLPGDDLLEIHDPELEPAELMAEIRRRIQNRRKELGYDDRTFPSFGDAVALPEPPQDLTYSAELYHHLRQANTLYDEVETEPVLAYSASLRLPGLGRLWLIRRQAHSLVLFYVNRNLSHQVMVNRHMVSILNKLVEENSELKRRIKQLEEKDNQNSGSGSQS